MSRFHRVAGAALLLGSTALAQEPVEAERKPAAPVAAPTAALTAEALPTGIELFHGRFEFGSYGRVGVGSDLAGRLGTSANIVTHGPRLLEESYAELELRREDEWGPVRSRVVATVAFFPPFFHFNGDSAQHIVLRNLYAEAATSSAFSAWAGSRMFRGDDIYLLDFWPLDDLNTVGGGVRLGFGATSLQLHAGMQRLDQPTQHQVVLNDNPVGFGSTSVTLLDRPRFVESVKLSHELKGDGFGARLSLYGEVHEIPGGKARSTVTGDESALPADWGLMVGAQGSVWMPGNRFAHLWVRESVGLATYDELSSPATFANDHTTQGAHSTRFAFATGWDSAHLGLMVGGYLDLVRDAGVSQVSAQKYDEGSIAARLQWYAAKYFGVAAEASLQRRVYALVDPDTGALRGGSVGQLAVMPYFSPLGPGLFSRPQLRLIYAISFRDPGARSFYAAEDVAAQRGISHFVGLNVEWWFNATTYGGK